MSEQQQFKYIVRLFGFMQLYGDLIPVAVILIITPPIHRGVNILAYKFKMKDVPW
jgi:CDP-2,3-bis-(O-geranylgeranyl)-sn-glycerol synthase